MPPDDFMVMVREGGVVGPTDKSYKLYIGKALTEDEKVARKQRWLETDAMARAIRDLGAQDGKTQEQIDADLEKMWAENNDLHLQSSSEGKFYTVHLSPEQGWEFYSLWQDKKVVWGYPGYPYRRLYLPGPSDAPPSTTTQEPGGSHVEA
jgi:hypothetical protein